MRSLRLVVIGTMASNPYAGMAWMHMQLTAGLRRLGHDVYYFETTSNWPYDPIRQTKVEDSDYAVPYLARVAASFGLDGRWAYRRSYSDKRWFGLDRVRAEDLLAHADLVFNVTGATRLAEEGLRAGRLVYVGTDPVIHEIAYAKGDSGARSLIDEHDDCVTYGENIGNPGCSIPPLPRLRAKTRQPVLLDLWQATPAVAWSPPAVAPPAVAWSPDHATTGAFTTVGNWKQGGRDITYQGDTYYWSKHREFIKFLDLPLRLGFQKGDCPFEERGTVPFLKPLELAMNLAEPETMRHGPGEAVPALGLAVDERRLLAANGWRLVDSRALTADPWPYRDYIRASRGEFTVARDLNVRLKSGWFSERSACYLAAGRPVVTQDTGFGAVLPTGEGLFAFTTMEDILAAFEAINSDYAKHSRAARAIAEDYFRAETVLAKLLQDLGF